MKKLFTAALLVLGIAVTATAADKEKHDHGHEKKLGPTNGKLITEVEPHVEFLVTKDKKIEIRFVNDDNKVVAPGEQVISVIIGDRSNPVKLAFTKEGDKLVSDKAIPEGNDLPTVVQIKANAGAKAVNEKFNLNLEKCPTCKNQEYNCTCEHGDDHDHKDEKKK
jgi:hypothetical protein